MLFFVFIFNLELSTPFTAFTFNPPIKISPLACGLGSKLIFFDDKTKAIDFINLYAPEHYIINVQDESFFVDNIVSAGSVFIGNYTPESAGDYASGTNHTLPTNGNAKQYSGVNLDSFQKTITFQKISKTGLLNISKTVETMAQAEGLQAHKNAVSIRVKDLKS